MAMTYEQHKTAVDAANPTPLLVWYLHQDNASHKHDDEAIADAFATFDGEEYEHELHVYGGSDNRGPVYSYFAMKVGAEGAIRTPSPSIRNWEAAKPAVQGFWDDHCERIRIRMAQEAHIKDILADDGIVARPAFPVATPATATLVGIGPNSATLSHWTLALDFAVGHV